MKFQKDYKDTITKFCDSLNTISTVIKELYELKDDAVKQVVNEETTVNDLLHFLELESGIQPKVLERTSVLIGDSRKIRRDAKMVLQDINNLNNVSSINIGEFEKMCSNLKETLCNFNHIFDKPLEYKPKKINFSKLKGDAKCVVL